MAIALDTSATHSGTSSFSYTCTGTNLYLLIAFHWVPSTASTASGVTYGGVSMTQISTHITNTCQIELWGLVAPATGSNTLAYTNTGTTTVTQTLISYTGVDQTTPLDATAVTASTAAFNSGAPVIMSVTTATANAQVVSALTASGSFVTTDLTVTAPSVLQQDNASGTGVGAIADSVTTTAGSYSVQWNRALATSRSAVGITTALRPVASGGTTTSSRMMSMGMG